MLNGEDATRTLLRPSEPDGRRYGNGYTQTRAHIGEENAQAKGDPADLR
jgi:hypothetical protein